MREININKDDRILIVAPHPDDECIGAGGLLSKYHSQCDVLILTDGGRGNSCISYDEEASIRKKQLEKEMDIVKPNDYFWLGLRDGELNQYSDYEEGIDWRLYDTFIISSKNDNHGDHAAANRYVIKKLRGRLDRNFSVYSYEVHLPFHNPTHYIDITSEIENKKRLIRCHEDQIEQTDYTIITTQLNKYRACMNRKYDSFYEAYMTVDVDCTDEETALEAQERTLQETYNQKRLYKSWIECLTSDDNSFIRELRNKEIGETDIYGLGPLGKSVYDYLLLKGVSVLSVIDKKNIRYRQVNSVDIDAVETGTKNIIITILKEDRSLEEKLLIKGYENVMWLHHML